MTCEAINANRSDSDRLVLPAMTPAQAAKLVDILNVIHDAIWQQYGDDILFLDEPTDEPPFGDDDLPF